MDFSERSAPRPILQSNFQSEAEYARLPINTRFFDLFREDVLPSDNARRTQKTLKFRNNGHQSPGVARAAKKARLVGAPVSVPDIGHSTLGSESNPT